MYNFGIALKHDKDNNPEFRYLHLLKAYQDSYLYFKDLKALKTKDYSHLKNNNIMKVMTNSCNNNEELYKNAVLINDETYLKKDGVIFFIEMMEKEGFPNEEFKEWAQKQWSPTRIEALNRWDKEIEEKKNKLKLNKI